MNRYQQYLRSDKWQLIKAQKLLTCELSDCPKGVKCQGTGCGLFFPIDVIEVHHKTYERLGNERLDDLVVLCPACHGDQHGFLRPLWWHWAKRNGMKFITRETIREARSVQRIRQPMQFNCLDYCDKPVTKQVRREYERTKHIRPGGTE